LQGLSETSSEVENLLNLLFSFRAIIILVLCGEHHFHQ
jgi:hypothetical protein